MTETALREANQIPVGRRIKPGSLVLVSKASGLGNAEDISSDTIDASFALAQDYRRVTYRVRRGDNMRSVARRLGVSACDHHEEQRPALPTSARRPDTSCQCADRYPSDDFLTPLYG